MYFYELWQQGKVFLIKNNITIWYLIGYLTKYLTRYLVVSMLRLAFHFEGILGYSDAILSKPLGPK